MPRPFTSFPLRQAQSIALVFAVHLAKPTRRASQADERATRRCNFYFFLAGDPCPTCRSVRCQLEEGGVAAERCASDPFGADRKDRPNNYPPSAGTPGTPESVAPGYISLRKARSSSQARPVPLDRTVLLYWRVRWQCSRQSGVGQRLAPGLARRTTVGPGSGAGPRLHASVVHQTTLDLCLRASWNS